MILATLLLSLPSLAANDDEATYYAVDYLTPPDGAVLEVEPGVGADGLVLTAPLVAAELRLLPRRS